LISQAEAKKA
jgi:hypothetical protein